MQKSKSANTTSTAADTTKTGGIVALLQSRPIWVLLLLSCLLYANSLSNKFAIDDVGTRVQNTFVAEGLRGIPQILSTPYRFGFDPSTNDLYRPLSLVTFAIEQSLFADQPSAGHLINVLLFAACVVVLFRFLKDIFGTTQNDVILLTCILFAAHPIHTEVVANIKSRDELLCFWLGISALRYYIKWAGTAKVLPLLMGTALLFLSLLSKESSIALVALLPITLWAFTHSNAKRIAIASTLAIAVAVLFIALRAHILSTHGANHIEDTPFIDNILVKATGTQKIGTAMYVLGRYILLLFVPYPLLCDYSFKNIQLVDLSNIKALAAIAVYIGLAAIAVYRLLQNKKDMLSYGILFFLVTIALFSNLLLTIGAVMAERFLFFASAGFCLALVATAQVIIAKQGSATSMLSTKGVLPVLAAIVAIYSLLTISRNADWYDNITLLKADCAKSPDNAKLMRFMGNNLVITNYEAAETPAEKQQILQEGISYLEKAVQLYPGFAQAHEDLAHAYYMANNTAAEMQHDRIAIALSDHSIIALNDIAGLFFAQKQYDSCIYYLKKGTQAAAFRPDMYFNMGLCYWEMGNTAEAIANIQKARASDENNKQYSLKLYEIYTKLGISDSARKYESIARMPG